MTEKLTNDRLGAAEVVDLRDMIRELWSKRWLVAGGTLSALILAGVYAFFIAKPIYVSSALLIPTQVKTLDQLGAAASLLGRKTDGNGDLDLYQSLLTSRTVIHKLLVAQIEDRSDTGKGKLVPVYKLLKIDTSKPEVVESAVEGLSNSISVGTKENGDGGILDVKISASTPWTAQQIGNQILAIGQEELRLVRIQRADVILGRLEATVSQAREEWDLAAKNYTWFKGRNMSISGPTLIFELAKLEMEKQAKEQKYMLARKEYEMQLLEKAKAAPPMIVLDPANLPATKSKPKAKVILAIAFIVGFSGSCLFVLGYKAFIASEENAF